jgi:acetyl-CoA carboxylase biotin carboxyl carrier protein
MAEGQPLFEVRALLRTFLKSEWKSCHVVTDRLTLFASRDSAIRARDVGAANSSAPAPAVTSELTAPHLGTLVSLVAVGTSVAAGETYGALQVLDEERALIATTAGIVAGHHEEAGALVECGQPLLALVT